MQAFALPLSAGFTWIRDGWRLFRLQPITFLSWGMFLSLVLKAASAIPPIGPILFVIFLPAINLMTLTACKEESAGNRMQLGMWFAPLRQPGVLKRMVGMGALYFAICLLVGLVALLPFMNDLAVAVDLSTEAKDITPLLSAIRGPLIVFACLYILVASFFWYAPTLAGWHSISLLQSLFFSFVACWRNKLAFIVYGLLWLGIFLGIDLITGLMLSAGVSETVAWALQMPLNIIGVSVLYCSFYPNYVSVFFNAYYQSDSLAK